MKMKFLPFLQYKQSWEDMQEFIGVDLLESFVLFWNKLDNMFILEVELCIFRKVKNKLDLEINGIYDFKKAKIIFKNFDLITGLKDIEHVEPHIEDGEKIYGNIDGLAKLKNGYEIFGMFGDVVITGGEMYISAYA